MTPEEHKIAKVVLTDRQYVAICLRSERHKIVEIARLLGITESTVRDHLDVARRKIAKTSELSAAQPFTAAEF